MEKKLNPETVGAMLSLLNGLKATVAEGLKKNPDDEQLKTYEDALDKVSCTLNASGVAGEAH